MHFMRLFSLVNLFKSHFFLSWLPVSIYNELIVELENAKADVECESAQQAVQTIINDERDLLTWLKGN